VWEEAYLEWSSHNSTSVAGGLKMGEKGDAIYNFLPRRERGHSPGWGNPSLAYIPRALKQ
jgi:hypothetical protein